MSTIEILSSYLPEDNEITKDFTNKAFAILPPNTSRVKSVSNEVAKSVKDLLKLDYGWITPIIETLDNGSKRKYLARVEPHWHNLDGSQGKPLGAHKGISVFLSNDSIDREPYNEIPPSKKTNLLTKNDQSKKENFINKLEQFLDKMFS